MNFHPYSLKTGEIDEGWLQGQKRLYGVMHSFGAGDMPVWYTEFGWSDFARDTEKQLIGGKFLKAFEVIEKEPVIKKEISLEEIDNKMLTIDDFLKDIK